MLDSCVHSIVRTITGMHQQPPPVAVKKPGTKPPPAVAGNYSYFDTLILSFTYAYNILIYVK